AVGARLPAKAFCQPTSLWMTDRVRQQAGSYRSASTDTGHPPAPTDVVSGNHRSFTGSRGCGDLDHRFTSFAGRATTRRLLRIRQPAKNHNAPALLPGAGQGKTGRRRTALEECGRQAEEHRHGADDGRRRDSEQRNGRHHVMREERAGSHRHCADPERHDDVPAAFATAVRTGADHQHADQCRHAGQRGQYTDVEGIDHTGVLDERGHPEAHRVGAEQDGKVDAAEHPHFQIEKTVAEAVLAVLALGIVQTQLAFQQRLLSAVQPFGVFWRIRQRPEGHHPQQHAGNTLDQEQPLPAAQPGGLVEVAHDPARERPADDAGERQPDHEQGDDAATAVGRKPGGQVKQHAWQETRFRGAEEKPQHVKLRGRADEQGAGRQQAPGDHDPCDPDLRPDPFQHQIAGHFKQDIADKEQTGAEAESRLAEVQLIKHLQFGEADVDAVQVSGQIAEAQERNQLPGDLAVKRLDRVRRNSGGGVYIRRGHGYLLAVLRPVSAAAADLACVCGVRIWALYEAASCKKYRSARSLACSLQLAARSLCRLPLDARSLVAIADAFAHDDGAKTVLHRIHRRGANAAAGGASGKDDGVDALRVQH
nr:hypothetical protein [Tanacetum cinerariifolium]